MAVLLEWHSYGRKLNSVVIINSAIFDGKVSIAFELKLSTSFQIMESFYFFACAIINLIKLYFMGSAVALFTCILSKSSVNFYLWKFQIVIQSFHSPKFENMLLGDDLRRVFFLRWRCMWMKNRDSHNWLRDRVSQNKFDFDINWANNSQLNIVNRLFFCSKIA